jgi:hypothetical protein
MKKLHVFFVVLFMFASVVSFSIAADDQLATRDGINVRVQYDPMGPNNLIVAYVKFINENQYRVEVNWWPVITCESEDKREGPAASFSMNEGGTYVVNIWRSAACGQGRIKNIDVEMAVKKVNP